MDDEFTGKYFPAWVRPFVDHASTRHKTHRMFQNTVKLEVHYRDESDRKHAVSTVRRVLKFLRSEFVELPTKTLNLVLVLTHRRKVARRGAESDDVVISANEMNSAVCYKGRRAGDSPDIVIFRLEDMGKVLIHEMIHHLRRDLHRASIHQDHIVAIEESVKVAYPSVASVNVMFNEAFTEAYAQHLYCKGKFGQLEKQRELSARNVKRFLRSQRCETVDEFKTKVGYREVSHPFAYILLSSALLHDDQFLYMLEDEKNLNDDKMKRLHSIVERSIDASDWKKSVARVTNVGNVQFHFKLSV